MSARLARTSIVAAGAALVLAACGGGDTTEEETTGDAAGGGTSEETDGDTAASGEFDLVEDGTLTACSEVPFPPFEFEDASSSSGYSGFDIDLVQAIADNLGLELVVQDVSFDALQSGTVLAAGQCDMGASAMTITDEREENIDFSEPYYDSLQSLLVPVDSEIESIEDLAGSTVAVQQGTTGQNYAQENTPEGTELVDFPGDAEMWPALQAGNVDAILQDLPVNVEHVQADDSYEIVEEYDTSEQYGFAFPEGEKVELREAVNAELQTLRDEGTYDEIYSSYFGTEG